MQTSIPTKGRSNSHELRECFLNPELAKLASSTIVFLIMEDLQKRHAIQTENDCVLIMLESLSESDYSSPFLMRISYDYRGRYERMEAVGNSNDRKYLTKNPTGEGNSVWAPAAESDMFQMVEQWKDRIKRRLIK